MDSQTQIISIKNIPDYKKRLTGYVIKNWPPVKKHFIHILNQCLHSTQDLPQCFVLLQGKEIIGFYQLIKHELIKNKTLSPWITCVFVDEKMRGKGLGEKLTIHGRTIAGSLGYKKVYLTTDHIQYYEKLGFREIGIDIFEGGRPTKIYEHDTIIK